MLLIVNASPWGSTLAHTAMRFARAALAAGAPLAAVYFQGDGVYNAWSGRARDAGAADLAAEWASLARQHDVDLLLCSAAAARRWDDAVEAAVPGPFRPAGLAEVVERMGESARVVSF
ncbi:DsrE family protein [Marinihelvus fidelis]|nr:DsrE family protein [Marinihelvus fidelis]